jgi:hypothetical protein
MKFPISRDSHPRLYHPAGDVSYSYTPPTDPTLKFILENLVADCELYASQKPWQTIPVRPDSPYPYHQLYLTFYTGMHVTALMETYAFTWRITGDPRWLKRAKSWMNAAAMLEHSDRVEEHFYTANRYMQAFALALDLLDQELDRAEKRRAVSCLVRLMKRWWPDVDRGRESSDGRHHAVVDNGHYGVAALYLLGKHPDAEMWLAAVIDRFRNGVMPYGCGKDGEPGDGASFWPWENMWMFHFADALRNVTGIDLYREFPKRLERPLTWFRYHLAPPRVIEDKLYYPAKSNVITGTQLNGCSPTLLRFAQETGDKEMRDAALKDPRLGRLYRFGMGAKGTSAECMVAYGPYAYCYYDPSFLPFGKSRVYPPSRTFKNAHYGETGILRTGWGSGAVVASVSGYKGGSAHGFTDLHLQWAGHPVLRSISAEEAQPVSCGSLPFVGGQNEVVSFLRKISCSDTHDRLCVQSIRTDHEYWLLKGQDPVLITALRRRKRGLKMMAHGSETFVRLNGGDYLQYDRKSHFNARAGELSVRFRTNKEIAGPQILFNTGIGVGRLMGSRVNSFSLGILEGSALTFVVQSQRNTSVEVCSKIKIKPGTWYEVVVKWGGFNRADDKPFIEIELDGHVERCEDAAAFGELGVDSQKLKSRKIARTFYIKSNTVLGFGAAVQMPETGMKCDISNIGLKCPGKRKLELSFEEDLGEETGSESFGWKLNPVDLRGVKKDRARLGAGSRALEVIPLVGDDFKLERETVPFAPSGLAAGSLKSFVKGSQNENDRLLVRSTGDILVLAFAGKKSNLSTQFREGGFSLRSGTEVHDFDVNTAGREILTKI